MTDWQTLNVLLAGLGALLSFVAAGLTFEQRYQAQSAVLGAAMLWAVGWTSLFYAFEYTSSDVEQVMLWGKFQYISLTSLPVLCFLFALVSSGRGHWLTWPMLLALWLVPLAVTLGVWTNAWHSLIWRSTSLRFEAGMPIFEPTYGPLFWVNIGYSYLFITLAGLFLLDVAWRSWWRERSLFFYVATAMVLASAGNLSEVLDVYPIPNLRLLPISFTLAGMTLMWGLFRHNLLGFSPVTYQDILDKLPEGVLVLDSQQRLVAVNEAMQPFLPQDAPPPIGQPFAEALPALSEALAPVLSQESAQFELAQGKNTLEIRKSPIYNRANKLKAFTFILRDVTARKVAEDEREQLLREVQGLEQLKTDMIRIAAHDLKNPLSAILSYLELLEIDNENFHPDQKRYLERTRAAAERMLRLIKDLLSLERIEAMRDSQTYEALNLAVLAQKLVKNYADQAQERQQRLRFQPLAPKALVRGDPVQLSEAMSNLLSNALKYTPDGGEIILRVLETEGCVRFEVQDNGYGIPLEYQSRLFSPFYRAERRATQNIEGTGLGLHLVKNIIERHQGQIGVESREGAGSRFYFTLPLAKKAALEGDPLKNGVGGL